MASIRKTNSGKYKAEVFAGGLRKSATFEKKSQATQWANSLQFQLDHSRAGIQRKIHEFTVLDIFQKWQKEVLPKRNGKRWDRLKLQHIMRWPGWNVRIVENLRQR